MKKEPLRTLRPLATGSTSLLVSEADHVREDCSRNGTLMPAGSPAAGANEARETAGRAPQKKSCDKKKTWNA